MSELNLEQDNEIRNQSTHAERRFYQPWVLAAYCIIVNIPMAIFLYGINVHRRGNIVVGNLLKYTSAVVLVLFMVFLAISETNVKSNILHTLFRTFVGIGLFKFETPYYKKAIMSGASPAKWWPPLLFVLLQVVVIILMSFLYDYIKELT